MKQIQNSVILIVWKILLLELGNLTYEELSNSIILTIRECFLFCFEQNTILLKTWSGKKIPNSGI